jgi:hypothetical protein
MLVSFELWLGSTSLCKTKMKEIMKINGDLIGRTFGLILGEPDYKIFSL